jgi:hypothetical protein
MTAAVALLCGVVQNMAAPATLPPLPPLPPGVSITAKTNRVTLPAKPLPPVPNPRNRTVRDRESVLPKARWAEGYSGLPGKVIKHTFIHSTNSNTVTLIWESEPEARYAIDYAAGGHALWYPWEAEVGGWYGTNRTSWAMPMRGDHPGWWRVRKL